MTSGSSAQRATNEAEQTVAPIRPDGLSEGTVAEIRSSMDRAPWDAIGAGSVFAVA
jgi:hypothetical protein